MQSGLRRKRQTSDLETLLLKTLKNYSLESDQRKMLEYALGVGNTRRAKRFRAALCLQIADAYGVKSKVKKSALAIELFHNFSLIHDDIADHDEVRRNAPTLWKRWGEEFALNAGDTLLLLSILEILGDDTPSVVRESLAKAFLETCQGQHLDFELSKKKLSAVKEKEYLRMIEKKTGTLFRVAVFVPGIFAKVRTSERANLERIGTMLGITYQLIDDYRSIWSKERTTGKDSHSDIREKKRTLPILLAYSEAQESARRRLQRLFCSRAPLSKKDITKVLSLLNATSAKQTTEARIVAHKNDLRKKIASLHILEKKKSALWEMVENTMRI